MKINYDSRALTFDKKRQLILSGAIHYPRSTPDMWPDLMKKTKDAGLNTVESYVFWNLHEANKRDYDFSGRLNLIKFIEEADKAGLKFILRIGPYICAEINYGGFPLWLREEKGVQFRTWNEPFMREMELWIRYVCDMVKPYLATNGGPIIMAQIENEYVHMQKIAGRNGEKYINWAKNITHELGLDIPWFMCYGAPKGILETINDFNPHVFLDGTVDEYLNTHINEPAICTELWTGWIDVYGQPHHSRPPESVAYSVARFLAAGGTGINYYMWHGGTNFNREQMYLQTTSYDYDAPLDEFGNITSKYNHLKKLHLLIVKYQDFILNNTPPNPEVLTESVSSYSYEKNGRILRFLCNDNLKEEASVSINDKKYKLSAISVKILLDGEIIFDTSILDNDSIIIRNNIALDNKFTSSLFIPEPIPFYGQNAQSDSLKISSDYPIEQLSLTNDESDYCWYTTIIDIAKSQDETNILLLEGVADFVYIYIDGVRVAKSGVPCLSRGTISGEGFNQSFKIKLSSGIHKLSILCCSLGLIKNNSLIGGDNMAEECKGLWGNIYLNGVKVNSKWEIYPKLIGEKSSSFFDNIKKRTPLIEKHPGWWKLSFNYSKNDIPLILDLTGMTKGVIWLNSNCVGRYWLTKSEYFGDFKPKDPTIKLEPLGSPSQSLYHLPFEWLKEKNDLILFDENSANPSSVKLLKRQ